MKTCGDCIHFRPLYGTVEVFCIKRNQFVFADWDACHMFAEGVWVSTPMPTGNSANTAFQQWMDDHTCDGCPTYEKYKGNPFGEKCATCVRSGQVTDNYGSER